MKNLSRRSFLQAAAIGTGTAAAAAALPSLLSTYKKSNVYDGKKLNIALCGLRRYAGYLATGLESAQYCKLTGIVTAHRPKQKNGGKNMPYHKRIFTTTRISMK
ncbi:MAG: twin-arginine translocation signal domain-containing protein [Bacteroidota bacterium]